MKSHLLTLVARNFAFLSLLLGASLALKGNALIYSETFSGLSTESLDGRAPSVGVGTWTSDIALRADGILPSLNSTSYNAFLPFSPESGKVYALSLDVNPGPANTANWIALGFTQRTSFTSIFSNAEPAPWMAARGQRDVAGDIFSNLSLFTGSAGHASALGTINLKIHLDTTDTLWTAEWFVNGESVRAPVSFAFNPLITHVGFGRFEDVAGTLDNFTLAVIPEPSAAALFGATTLVVAMVRRRRIQG